MVHPILGRWSYQPERREHGHSWYDMLLEQRGQLQGLLDDNPSLRSQVETLLVQHYARARRRAMGEMPFSATTFPHACPWSAAQVLDDDFAENLVRLERRQGRNKPC